MERENQRAIWNICLPIIIGATVSTWLPKAHIHNCINHCIKCIVYTRHDQYWQIAYPKFLVEQNLLQKGLP